MLPIFKYFKIEKKKICTDLPIFFSPQTSDMGITEHIENDECKFAVWTGRTPVIEHKMILKVND